MSKRARSTRGQASSSCEEMMEEKVRMLLIRIFYPIKVFPSHSSTPSIPIPSPGYNGLTFFQINELIFCELVCKFFTLFEFDASPCREGVVCNIPYWLARYLKGVRDKSVIFGGMFVTKIARSFGLITEEMIATKGVIEGNKGDDEEGDGEGGNEGVGGSADI
nr:zinc finger, CCHC-type [Tanacetum cinerariifolium]